MSIYSLIKFPMPPTSNLMYTPIRGRFIKSWANRVYTKDVNYYQFLNIKKLEEIRNNLTGKEISIVSIFYFPKSSLYTKKDTVKKLDVTNRLKASLDELSRIIEIDDSYFFHVSCIKQPIQSNEPYIDFMLSDLPK